MATVRLTERFSFSGGKVRRGGAYPVIEGVLLCGRESLNRRRYLDGAFGPPGKKLYEGKPVFIDHTDAKGRKYRDHIGWVENERRDDKGRPIGDIGVKPTHADAESVLWDAEHRPQNCGMSHVAECKTKNGRDGWCDVEAVRDVESVDIVIGPATTKSFYEQGGATVSQISLKQFVERFGPKWGPVKWGAATKLCEDMGDLSAAPVMDSPPDDDSTDGDLKTALMSALTPLLDEAFESGDADKAASALRDFIKLHAKHTGKKTDDAPKDDAPKESKVPAADVLAECAAAEFSPTYEQGEHLRAIPDKGTRAVVIESFKSAAAIRVAEVPRSTGRKPPVKEEAPATEATSESIKSRWVGK